MQTDSVSTAKTSARVSADSEPLAVQDWGVVPYAEALQRQMDLVELVSREHARETLVFARILRSSPLAAAPKSATFSGGRAKR